MPLAWRHPECRFTKTRRALSYAPTQDRLGNVRTKLTAMIRHGFATFLFCGLACALAAPTLAQDDMPKGPLPDAAAAIALAHVFLTHLDAATGIATPEPLSATRDGDIWVVESPHKCADTANSACNSEV